MVLTLLIGSRDFWGFKGSPLTGTRGSTLRQKWEPDKTEFIVFRTRCQSNNFNKHFPVHILGEPLHPTNSVRNLSLWFDSDFSLSKHVQCIFCSCFVQLRDFRRARQYLSTDVSVLVANALISSRLNYCNSLLGAY